MEKDQTTLTLRQQRFVDCYLADGCKNAKAAAVAAGYSARYAGQNAGKLLKNPSVARALAQRQQTISQQANIDATYVIQGLVRVFETCSARVPAVNMMGEQVQDESGRPAPKRAKTIRFRALPRVCNRHWMRCPQPGAVRKSAITVANFLINSMNTVAELVWRGDLTVSRLLRNGPQSIASVRKRS